MTEISHFLETEAVLNALLSEMKDLKSAADQIGEAKNTAQTVTKTAEAVVQHAADLTKSSDKILENLVDLRRLIQVTDQQIVESNEKIEIVQAQVAAIADDMRIKNKEFAEKIEQIGKTGKLNRTLVIIGLVMLGIILALVAIPFIRSFPIQ